MALGEDANRVETQEVIHGPSEVCRIRKWIQLAVEIEPYPFKREIASCPEAFLFTVRPACMLLPTRAVVHFFFLFKLPSSLKKLNVTSIC